MPDELDPTIESILQQTFDELLAALRVGLAERLVKEFAAAQQAAAAEATRSATASTAEALNLAVRRIRRASSITATGAALLETAGAYCGRAALMVHKAGSLSGWRTSGFGSGNNGFAESWARFQVAVSDAPALAQAVETRDAVVSRSLPDHLSPALVALFGTPPEEKAYLFPLSLRQKVVAILYADAVGAEQVQPAALELLCAVAEATIETLSTRPFPPAAPGPAGAAPERRPSPAPTKPPEWESLSPGERDLHLRAQRFARVLVADVQLYRPEEIREGKKTHNLYGALKEEIDKSREVYYRKFGQSIPSIDYFHLELLRTLAADQEELLGPGYPGPMTEEIFR